MELFPDNCMNAWTIRRELRHSKCWVVDGETGLKAYLLVRVAGDLVDVLRVGVREDHRGQLLGYRLMCKALSLAPRAVLMVRKSNAKAFRLYQGLGFRIAGEFEQSWMMLKPAGGPCSCT